MVDASSFALFELDAKLCRIGLWEPVPGEQGPRVQELATISPVLAKDPEAGWLLGEPALGRRIVAPELCVLDLFEPTDPDALQARAAHWPFASVACHPVHGVCWEIEHKLYPRAYLLSQILGYARELAEETGQCELRSMALIVGRSVTPALRADLEQAAQLAGIGRLWWVDRMHALARSMMAQRAQARLQPDPTPQARVDHPAQDGQDALSQIDEVLRGAAPSGPSTAQLSHAEFGPPAVAAAEPAQVGLASSPDPVSGSNDAQSVNPEGSEDGSDSLPSDEADKDTSAQEPEPVASPDASLIEEAEQDASPDLAGQWLWAADNLGLELTQFAMEPELQILSRDLILGVSSLEWQAKVVAQLQQDLSEEQVNLETRRLAQVRVWDACGKMMDRLAKEAQTELNLPHLCVRKDQSFHYQSSWNRRRMDALIADAVNQLKSRCQSPAGAQVQDGETSFEDRPSEPEAGEQWQWGRYGRASEMPAFVRVAQQCSWLSRKDAKLPADSALNGAGLWIAERQNSGQRRVVADIMLGDLEWEHDNGFRKRCEVHGQSLPLTQDLDLQGAPVDQDEPGSWSVYLCLPGAEPEQERRYCVTRVLLPDYEKDARVRMQVQRNGKILVSRSPAAKNAGVQELTPQLTGLSAEQIQDLEIAQTKRDLDRFMGMRSDAMRKELAKHSAELGRILSERGDKMDDLLRTRLGEWVHAAKAQLTPELAEQRNQAALAALTPVHQELLAMVETLSAQQKKSLGIELAKLPELMEEPPELAMPSGTKPWWQAPAAVESLHESSAQLAPLA